MRDSIEDWTDERERSLTSRQVEERERSPRVRVLEEEDEARTESVSFLRVWRMTESGLTRFLNG